LSEERGIAIDYIGFNREAQRLGQKKTTVREIIGKESHLAKNWEGALTARATRKMM